MREGVELRVLGGCGETGRVGFEVKFGKTEPMILDFGVKRKLLTKERDEIYPMLPEENPIFVYLSHFHQDHSGSIPLLLKNFKRIDFLCSNPTFDIFDSYVMAWYKTAVEYGIPVDENAYQNFTKRNLRRLDLDGISDPHFSLLMGKSGHVVGSTWLWVDVDGFKTLYTGDLCPDSPIFKYEDPPKADLLILDTAYGVERMMGKDEITDFVVRKLEEFDRVILPLPRLGRSQEIVHMLFKRGDCEPLGIHLDRKIAESTKLTFRYVQWLKLERLDDEFIQFLERMRVVESPEDLEGKGLYLLSDGMMSGGLSKMALVKFMEDPRTAFILTGRQEEGTPGWKILMDEGMKKRVFQLIWKVHPDVSDIVDIIEKVEPTHVVPFHCSKKCTEDTINLLSGRFKKTVFHSLNVGDRLYIEKIGRFD